MHCPNSASEEQYSFSDFQAVAEVALSVSQQMVSVLHFLGAGHPGADVVAQPAEHQVAVEVPQLLIRQPLAHVAVDLRHGMRPGGGRAALAQHTYITMPDIAWYCGSHKTLS